MTSDIFFKLILMYLLIGLMISLLSGAWKKLEGQRTWGMKVLQIGVLWLLWLPVMMIETLRGRGQ